MLSHVAENSTGQGWHVSDSVTQQNTTSNTPFLRAYIPTVQIFSFSTGEGLGGDYRNNVKGGEIKNLKKAVSMSSKFFTADKTQLLHVPSLWLTGSASMDKREYFILLLKQNNNNKKTHGKCVLLQDANAVK